MAIPTPPAGTPEECAKNTERINQRIQAGLELLRKHYTVTECEVDQAILAFARAYADQNEADYTRFMEALSAGELE